MLKNLYKEISFIKLVHLIYSVILNLSIFECSYYVSWKNFSQRYFIDYINLFFHGARKESKVLSIPRSSKFINKELIYDTFNIETPFCKTLCTPIPAFFYSNNLTILHIKFIGCFVKFMNIHLFAAIILRILSLIFFLLRNWYQIWLFLQ